LYNNAIILLGSKAYLNMDTRPRVSLGLPVFNGEAFLNQSLNSIVKQTFVDFELIVSDNASTDNTQEICERFAASDPRIRYYRQKTNIGARRNYNFVFEKSRGEYFKWCAHDDVVAPTFLEECVSILDRNPTIVLCNTTFLDIDDEGNPLTRIQRNRGDANTPYERFARLISLDYDCEEVFGLIRSVILRKTGLIRNYTDSDRTLLAELGLHGKLAHVPKVLFYHRLHPDSSVQSFPDWNNRVIWFNPSLQGKFVLPRWLQMLDYLSVIAKGPLSLKEKSRCYLKMISWVWSFRRGLVRDVIIAFFGLARLPLPKRFRKRSSFVKYVDGATPINEAEFNIMTGSAPTDRSSIRL